MPAPINGAKKWKIEAYDMTRKRSGKLNFHAILIATIFMLATTFCASSVAWGHMRLKQGFEFPPRVAHPRLWWHWMNGNVTRNGIHQDLQWMHKIGIGGVNVISASIATPTVVNKPLVYMTPRWKRMFRYAARLAGRYHMEFGIDSSPGWSETGGPWVKPSQAMKKLVWSTTVVEGGKPFHGVLPQPPSNTGPFQDAPMTPTFLGKPKYVHLKFYRDSLVIAYREPVAHTSPVAGASNAGALRPHSLGELSDGKLTDGLRLAARHGTAWIQLDYAKPTLMQGVTLAASVSDTGDMATTVYVSGNGTRWKRVAWFKPAPAVLGMKFPQETEAFAPCMARYVRIVMRTAPTPRRSPKSPFFYNAPGAVPVAARFIARNKLKSASPSFHVHEIVLHSRATVNQFEAKADFRIAPDYYALDSQLPIAPRTAVNPKDVVNLTAFMQSNGTLDWTPPPGRWVILRMGYSLEGTTNHPAPAVATGLESDKLSRADVKSYVEHYLGMFRAVTGPFGKPGSLTAMTNDSTEVGMQDWTSHMIADFERLRGYNPIPWLPALTGVVVGNRSETNKFLWDFRHTIKELVATNHYQEVQKVASADGLTTYAEALENGRPSFGDDMQMRRYTDIPMGAMWMYRPGNGPDPTYIADLKGAASVAHIYGRKLVAAESLDSVDQPWAFGPRQLKRVVDKEFLLGVNRIVIHESSEQPINRPPGLSLSFFGQMFNRLDAWAPEAGPWIRYISRCSYLLQQGHYAAQIAYFYGQAAPITGLFKNKRINVPAGYGYDFVNSNILMNRLEVKDGRLVTASGMSYRVLFLGGTSKWMTLRVLERINTLVHDGATVVGKRPLGSPSLRDNAAEFQQLAQKLFGPPGGAVTRHVGMGTVFTNGSLPFALKELRIEPYFDYTSDHEDTRVQAVQHKLKAGDLFFVSNRKNHSAWVEASFDVSGYVPQLWNAVTGRIRPVSYRIEGGRTEVPLHLAPYGSIFVVFRKSAATSSKQLPKTPVRTLLTLHGPWHIAFARGLGAPSSIVLPHLASWTTSRIPGVKYFSGTATYTHTFNLNGSERAGRILLDLGNLDELARVSVNGKKVGLVWTPPFRLDITRYVHPGMNTLSIAVTNLWVNRLIGDQQPGVKHKYTFTIIPTYEPDAPLRTSGLLGPVHLQEVWAN
jgi:hypothetical protein